MTQSRESEIVREQIAAAGERDKAVAAVVRAGKYLGLRILWSERGDDEPVPVPAVELRRFQAAYRRYERARIRAKEAGVA